MQYEHTVTIRKTRGDDIDAACGSWWEMLLIALKEPKPNNLMDKRFQ